MRRFSALLIFFLLLICYSSVSFAQNLTVNISKDSLDSGILSISCLYDKNIKLKLMIQKDDIKYSYNLKADGKYENFPLQSGDGNYEISIFQNVEANNYVMAFRDNVNVKLGNKNIVYLNSIQMIKFDESAESVKKARELTAGLTKDKDKVEAVYNFIKLNIKYDYEKLRNLSNDYLPDADKILSEKKGICYDYASLFAVMLRSAGIPTKLDMGYTKNINGYHAWNEVYIKELDTWVVIDATYDSILNVSSIKTDMIKETEKYQKTKEY